MHRSTSRRIRTRCGIGLALLFSTSAMVSPALAQAPAAPEATPAATPSAASDAPAAPPAQAAPAAAPAPAGTTPPATTPAAPDAAAPAQPGPPGPPPMVAPPPQTGVVQRIDIEGNERIESETIASYLPIQAGDTVSPEQIDVAVKTLFKTDLFSDVNIVLQPGGDLVVRVVENPIVNQVVFEGNDNMKDDKLRDEVQVRPRGIFTKGKVQADVQRIVELYRRSGRIGVTVTPQIVQLPQKRIDLIFEINEGPKSGVMRINFLGNRRFSDNDLRGVVVTKESRIYRFLSSNDNYDPDRLDYDQEQLRKYYRNHGFYDFRIVNTVAELAPDKNGFVVTYTLDEGERYKFGKVSVNTQLKKLNGAVLRQLLPIRPGQLYQDEKIEQATDSLTYAAGAAGFAFVDIQPHYTPNRSNHTVDVVFDVKEGPRVYVGRIDIVGNTRTLDYVIRRELLLSEGDAYNRVLVDRSKLGVRALGFFKDVDVTQTAGDAPDRTNLQVKVTEQPTGELSFSAGYSSIDRLVTDIGISERNFGGRGQDVRANVSIGSLRQQVDLGFTEPKFLNRNLSAGFNLYTYRYDFTQYAGYRSDSTGGSVQFGFPLSPYMTLSTRYALHSDGVVVSQAQCGNPPTLSPVICNQIGTTITSAPGYTLRWDHRNDPINPTRGYFTQLSQDFAGFGGNVKYVKTVLNGGWYHGFTPSFILSLTGTAGYISSWGGDYVRINDRFFEGGNTFYGFEIAGIGPRDTNKNYDQALGAKMYAIGTLTQTFPDGLPEQYGIKTAAFVQFGTAGLLDPDAKRNPLTHSIIPTIRDDLALRVSTGIQVFWKSPLGPLEIDLAVPLVKQPYDRTQSINFTTSTRFN